MVDNLIMSVDFRNERRRTDFSSKVRIGYTSLAALRPPMEFTFSPRPF